MRLQRYSNERDDWAFAIVISNELIGIAFWKWSLDFWRSDDLKGEGDG